MPDTSQQHHADKASEKCSFYDVESTAHPLSSTQMGESEVEQIAERIEKRREQRLPVTFKSRVRFLKECYRISRQQGYNEAKISLSDLKEFRDRVKEEVANHKGICNNPIMKALCIYADVDCLLSILDRAVDLTENSDLDDSWLFYPDFSHYHT